MAIELIDTYPQAAVASGGTLTFTYPAGRTAGEYGRGGTRLVATALQSAFMETTNFTIAYGGSSAVVTYNGATTIPKFTKVTLELDVRDTLDGEDLVTPTGGTVKQPLADVLGDLKASTVAAAREKLSADRTYYVRTNGSDANDGRTNTAGGAFLTVQKAVDIAFDTLDLNGKTVTIQLADGTYTTAATAIYRREKNVGGGIVYVVGNKTTPSNVVLTVTAGGGVQMYNGASISVEGFKINCTTRGLYVAWGGAIFYNNIDFGVCGDYQIRASGGYIWCTSVSGGALQYTISGGAGAHMAAHAGGTIYVVAVAITLTGTPNFTNAFVSSGTAGSIEISSTTFSGSATGVRFRAEPGGTWSTASTSETFFPGSIAGTISVGGISPTGVPNQPSNSYYSVYSGQVVADDGVVSFDLTAIGGGVPTIKINTLSGSKTAVPRGEFAARATATFIENISLDLTNVVLTTGALTGTTGIDGKFTIAVHTDGKIYFENRTAASRQITLQLLY